jgi:hypothetical protein
MAIEAFEHIRDAASGASFGRRQHKTNRFSGWSFF